MPVTKSAKKKLRQDKKREIRRKKLKDTLQDTIKKARRAPTIISVKKAGQLIDKAAKNHLVHKNKAARIKSSLAKLISKDRKVTEAPKKTRKSAKKKLL